MYTKRMRKLSIGSSQIYFWQNSTHVSVHSSVFTAIEHAISDGMHPKPFLPRLRTIIFNETLQSPSWCLLSLMTATVTSLDIHIILAPEILGAHLGMQTVLASLHNKCPLLCDLTVTSNQSSMGDFLPHLGTGLLGMQNLTILRVSDFPLSKSTLFEISNIPHLKQLSFNIDGLNINDIPSNFTFPALTRCIIRGNNKDTAVVFMKAFTSPSFADLDVIVDTSFTSYDIHEILTHLLHFHLTIKHIRFSWLLDPDRDGASISHNNDNINPLILAPLLEFSRLESFKINVLPSLKEINDAFIHQLALSCPLLQQLDLGSSGVVCVPTQTTLAGLVSLASNCRQLSSVGLYFDCSDMQSWYTRLTQSNNNTACLFVGCSTINNSDIDITAEFLLKLFPNLTTIHYQDNTNHIDENDKDGPQNENPSKLQWDSVSAQVRQYNHRKLSKSNFNKNFLWILKNYASGFFLNTFPWTE